MDRSEKEKVVDELREALTGASSVVLASSLGMTATRVNELRSALRAQGVKYTIVKNTLAKRAIAGTDLEGLADHFRGPTAVAYHAEDAVVTAKVLVDFGKKEDKLDIKAGYLSGNVLSEADVQALSEMPSLDELRAKILMAINAVPTNIARVINAVPTGILNVINARKDSLSA